MLDIMGRSTNRAGAVAGDELLGCLPAARSSGLASSRASADPASNTDVLAVFDDSLYALAAAWLGQPLQGNTSTLDQPQAKPDGNSPSHEVSTPNPPPAARQPFGKAIVSAVPIQPHEELAAQAGGLSAAAGADANSTVNAPPAADQFHQTILPTPPGGCLPDQTALAGPPHSGRLMDENPARVMPEAPDASPSGLPQAASIAPLPAVSRHSDLPAQDDSRPQPPNNLMVDEPDHVHTSRPEQIIATSAGGLLPQVLPASDTSDVAAPESTRSDESSPIRRTDSWFAAQPQLNEAASPAGHHSPRPELGSGPSATEQVFGDIVSRLDLTRQDGRVDFRLQLDPPDLGAVHVHLTATENAISARLFVEDAKAHEAVASQLEGLRDSLADLGVSLTLLGFAGDGSGSRGARQWQRPDFPSAMSRTDVPKTPKHPGTARARPPRGVIDVVV